MPVRIDRSLLLASASPRRSDLLRGLGIAFTVSPSGIDETRLGDEDPGAMAERLARAKAGAAVGTPSPSLVLAADTVVVVDGDVLGKPADRAESLRMLARLAGRTHEVITAITLRALPEETVTAERAVSRVTFAPLSEEEIRWYAATGEGADKAGAYALQGLGALFVISIEGSYTNVIGLPLDRLYPHLRRWGFLP